MTSRASSSTEKRRGAGFLTRQRELARRRLWPIALTFLVYFLYHVVLAATVLTSVGTDPSQGQAAAADRIRQLMEIAADIFGKTSPSALMIAFPIAVILAIEGFAWLDDRRQVDFYESQPVSRIRRFTEICTGSFLYFIFSYAITLEMGLLIAGALGAVTRSLLAEAAWRFLCTVTLFLSVYGLGVLAVMLTGNVVVAVLAFLVLYLYEPFMHLLINGFCSEFLYTWSSRQTLFGNLIFNPVYHFQTGGKQTPVRLLALAALFLVLSWICYRLRRNEHAGEAVVFDPVRTVVRIAIAVFAGLGAGLLFTSVQSQNRGLFPAVLWMVLFTVITACIMQIIYEYDFRALFQRPVEIAAAVVIVLAVYMGFYLDVMGFDRWIPEADQVSDAALVYQTGEYEPFFTDEGKQVTQGEFGEKYMHLENVEDVIALARYGQEYTREKCMKAGRSGQDYRDDMDTEAITEYSFLVRYNMKNGKTVSRSFVLPSSIDPAMMDNVIATPAYREGTFNLYHDEFIRVNADSFILEVNNGDRWDSIRLTSEQYESLRKAYLEDLAQFSYTFARKYRPVEKMYISYHEVHVGDPHPELENASIACPVYPSFSSTIAALQEAGVWLEPVDFEGLPLATYTSEPDALTREEKEYLDSLDFSVFGGPFHYDY